MAEENQQITTQQVTTRNPKKVEVGKRLAEYNRKKKEELKAQKSEEQKSEVIQYYGIGAVLAVGVIGDLGYYIYQTKAKKCCTSSEATLPQQPHPQTDKFEME